MGFFYGILEVNVSKLSECTDHIWTV